MKKQRVKKGARRSKVTLLTLADQIQGVSDRVHAHGLLLYNLTTPNQAGSDAYTLDMAKREIVRLRSDFEKERIETKGIIQAFLTALARVERERSAVK